MNDEIKKCHFCGSEEMGKVHRGGIIEDISPTNYICPRCGHVYLTRSASDDFEGERFTDEEKAIISIQIRNEFERNARVPFKNKKTLDDLRLLFRQYSNMDALEKMDNALLNIEKSTTYFGHHISIDPKIDYPYYHCISNRELISIISFLYQSKYIEVVDPKNAYTAFQISPGGYQRLREIKLKSDSRQCFVAMWFDDEVKEAYENAIKPAIEYVEEGELQPRFKSLIISEKEHTNDINDEIIAEIRRSRFMVCDLTGYRGGVYWEAGFAYGLGLEVIYTCRKDWVKEKTIKYYDSQNNQVDIKQEGIHFDLEHRNRITWSQDDLPKFKNDLKNRIRAVII